MKNITFIVGLHGNEIFPVKALKDMEVPHIVGNPEALKKGVRFIDEDLNASFGTSTNSIESNRAQELLKEIPANHLVVDFHTTKAKTPPFVILVDKDMISLASKTGIQKVVLMTENIKKGNALINHHNGISIEMGHHDDLENSYDKVQEVVKNISTDTSHPIELYEVYETINEPINYENFKESPEGYFPILVGETSYHTKGIYGLKARLIK